MAEKETSTSDKLTPKQTCLGCLTILVIAAVIATFATVCGADPEPREWHERCLGGWDGSHRGVNNLLKAGLLSPDSFDHISTEYMVNPQADGNHRIRVRFSAENAFGDRIQHTGWGVVNPKTCKATDAWIVGTR